MYIKISADSACDLSPELLETYRIHIFPLTITLGYSSGKDGIDIKREDIYRFVDGGGDLPATAAVSPADYEEKFAEWSKEYEAVIHVSLGSAISSCYQNARIAAADYPNVYVVDSCNLSSGYGHVVVEAALLSRTALIPEQIVGKLTALTPRVSTSFVMSRLDYMRKGGRCTTIEMLGANLLKLKPMIAVKNGKMAMEKKYRGSFDRCLKEYVAEQLQGREDLVRHRIFITHSGVSEGIVDMVREEIKKYADFEEIIETNAGCTISSHCGYGTLGILFITK